MNYFDDCDWAKNKKRAKVGERGTEREGEIWVSVVVRGFDRRVNDFVHYSLVRNMSEREVETLD